MRFIPVILLLTCMVGELWAAPLGVASGRLKKKADSRREYLAVKDFAKRHGFPRPVLRERQILLQRGAVKLNLKENSRQAAFLDMNLWLNAGTRNLQNTWTIPAVDVLKTFDPLLQPSRFLQQAGCKRIVIDPGHGGADSGTRGEFRTQEKDMVLKISFQLRNLLAAAGYEVLMTRTKDVFIPLEERCRIAEKWKADLFVSVHLNSAGNKVSNGIESYVLSIPGYPSTNNPADDAPDKAEYSGNRFDEANMILAFHVQQNLLLSTHRPDRGIKRARFAVLKNAPCPAVLVECGFLSNRQEAGLIIDKDYRDRLAQGLSLGILRYCDQVRKARLTTF